MWVVCGPVIGFKNKHRLDFPKKGAILDNSDQSLKSPVETELRYFRPILSNLGTLLEVRGMSCPGNGDGSVPNGYTVSLSCQWGPENQTPLGALPKKIMRLCPPHLPVSVPTGIDLTRPSQPC